MSATDIRDCVTVYLNTRTGDALVFAEAKRGRYAQGEIGPPVVVREAEFESKMAGVLLSCLDSFRTNVFSPESARRTSDSEYHDFRKQHLGVSAERPSSGDIILRPLHHLQGGYVANRGEQIVVRSEDVPNKIATALREAFKLAT